MKNIIECEFTFEYDYCDFIEHFRWKRNLWPQFILQHVLHTGMTRLLLVSFIVVFFFDIRYKMCCEYISVCTAAKYTTPFTVSPPICYNMLTIKFG